mgnify:CR=1 FL=1
MNNATQNKSLETVQDFCCIILLTLPTKINSKIYDKRIKT